MVDRLDIGWNLQHTRNLCQMFDLYLGHFTVKGNFSMTDFAQAAPDVCTGGGQRRRAPKIPRKLAN